MAFRILNQAPVYFNNAGVPCSSGTLTFSITGTGTLKTAYSDKALTTPVANPLSLDAAGRAPVDLWGSGSYRVVLKDSGGNVIKTLDNVDELNSGVTLPSPVALKYVYSADGSTFTMQTVRELPDPTGSAGKYLYTADGVVFSYRGQSNAPVVNTTASTGTLTPDVGFDAYHVTALAVPITIANPTGTWADGQGCVIRIKDNATPRAITFGTSYVAFDIALPTTTIASKEIYIPFVYNSTTAKWNVIRPSKQV